ncbi:nucleoside-diphosphate kinase [Candidatus Gottesmanbacteria bacterium RBG_16_43_7]|uniref:Nucleoside diphosphate kinase n=1 Tax=Candidatus Gottesmanbacteria bacterium RBG_16_43_7 TaxID=1798373 RepID=A0A1F5Z8V9_9BACT|nr:MAG: nucleoside-diphosphate kinase [Candidatus Gottesmanbacteria bacterium RBG_16_43_7]
MPEQTLVLVKPDGVAAGHIGEVISRIERVGLKITALKMVQLTQKILNKWYAHHRDKPFFADLSAMMMETPVVALIAEGEGAIAKVFDICGPTDPKEAAPGTIRRDLAESKQRNVVHRSDSAEAARIEAELLFDKNEIYPSY